jgi:hypothetical protein
MSWRCLENRKRFSVTPAAVNSKIHFLSGKAALCFDGIFAIFDGIAGTFSHPAATCIVDINNEKQIQD